MRRREYNPARVLRWLFFALLLAVTLREAPEISRLGDDVSNDGLTASWEQRASAQVLSLLITPQEIPCCLMAQPDLLAELSGFALVPQTCTSGGPDLLRLSSVQRE